MIASFDLRTHFRTRPRSASITLLALATVACGSAPANQPDESTGTERSADTYVASTCLMPEGYWNPPATYTVAQPYITIVSCWGRPPRCIAIPEPAGCDGVGQNAVVAEQSSGKYMGGINNQTNYALNTSYGSGISYAIVSQNTSSADPNQWTCTYSFTHVPFMAWMSDATQCGVTCPLSTTCPPGMYNTTSTGYASGQFDANGNPVGCSFTPPQVDQTVNNCPFTVPGNTVTSNIGIAAPVITSVTLGKDTVYGIGTPQSPLSASDKRSAVFAWGNNDANQLGNGGSQTATGTPAVPLYYPGKTVTQVVAGITDACALLDDKTVHCWGTMMAQTQAIPWPTERTVSFPGNATIKQITHGAYHACALTTAGQVYCWGENGQGQLGVPASVTGGPNTSYHGAPLLVDVAGGFTATNGNAAGQTPGAIDSVVASGNSTCVLAHGVPAGSASSIEGVYCWGDNAKGSLGNAEPGVGNSTYQAVLANAPVDDFGNPVDFTQLVGSSLGQTPSASGSFCALAPATAAGGSPWYCWGADADGQVNIPPPPPDPNNPSAGPAGIPAPTTMNTAQVFDATATILLGATHGCAIQSGQAWCFGDNSNGQLGYDPNASDPNSFPGIQTPLLVPRSPLRGSPPFTSVAAGANMTCGIYVQPGSNPPSYGAGTFYGNLACWGKAGEGLVSSWAPTTLKW